MATSKGNFEEDELSGFGVYVCRSGDQYEGEWLRGQKHGKGEFTGEETGDSYIGVYQYDKMCGKGVFRFGNGDLYQGDFRDDEVQGQGRMLYANGDLYEEASVGLPEAQEYKYADGDIHEGDFHNQKHSEGKFTLSDGTMEITGMWLLDTRVGDIPNEDGTTGDNKENTDNDGKDSDDDDDYLPPV